MWLLLAFCESEPAISINGDTASSLTPTARLEHPEALTRAVIHEKSGHMLRFVLQMHFAHDFQPSLLAFPKHYLKAVSRSGFQYMLRLVLLHSTWMKSEKLMADSQFRNQCFFISPV